MLDLSQHFNFVLIMSKLKYEQNIRYLSRKSHNQKEANENQRKWCRRFTAFVTTLAVLLVRMMINKNDDKYSQYFN